MSNEDFLALNVELVNRGLPLLHAEETEEFTVIIKGKLPEEVYKLATETYDAKKIEVEKD